MNQADRIWEEVGRDFERLGLIENPFSESATTLGQTQLRKVFTGRERELREVFGLFKGRERKRILLYGWIGIGKTAFILEVLDVLQRKGKKTLTAYISLPPETDLATAALIALCMKMENDEWAQHLLNQIGIRPKDPAIKRKEKFKAGVKVIEGEIEEETLPINKPLFPTLSFETLLKRALQKYNRVVIAIDDLDKQDPARARELLQNAQGLLKSGAWFMLTGHPSGLTREILIRELGLFDLALELKQLDQATMYEMLINYLNSARAKKTQFPLDDPKAAHPFTPETAKLLCRRSDGVPRWLNRLGSYVLTKAAERQTSIITPEILQEGFDYAHQQLRGQPGLTPEDYYILDLVLEKGVVSDENVELSELERIKAKEFNEILPILEKLVQHDLIRRLPTERAAEYEISPLLISEKQNIDKPGSEKQNE